VAADGLVDVDFDLPRFGVSLIAILPVVTASDGGTDIDGGSAPRIGSDNGCACRVGDRGNRAGNSSALLGMGLLALVILVRRRSAGTALSTG
jgi:MYXO-CTERM domain-containing protein